MHSRNMKCAGWAIFVLALSLPAPCFADKVTITLDFSQGDLAYPDGFQLTDQYEDQGILFIGGAQENVVVSGALFNPHIAFLQPVGEVAVVIVDHNLNPQTHTLLAYGTSGQLIDKHQKDATFTESGVDSVFTLSIKYPHGISEINTEADPPGAERLVYITFTRK
jgi:hypothetical protein